MLKLRNEEQIILSKLEMSQFITSITKDISNLKQEIKSLTSQESVLSKKTLKSFDSASILLKTQEVKRLSILLADAFAYQKYYYKEVEEKQELEEMILEVAGDDFNEDDCSEVEFSDDELYE